jgi:xylulokinase
MGRAVMEAIGFAVRRGVELLEAAGLPVVDMRVTGGQARGRVWNQMKADIVGRRLLIPEIEDAELAGAAACASVALGRSENILEASRSYVRIREVVEPDAEVGAAYDEAYARYREAVGSLLHR